MEPMDTLNPTFIPKPYEIVGHDPLIKRSNPEDGGFLDTQVNPKPGP